MRIRYLNGSRLKNALIAAADNVHKNQALLNRINVFPVPDGDTGTNMVITMQYVRNSAREVKSASIADVSQALADSALMGARGNSGAILAQFLQGFSDDMADKIQVSTVEFGQAVRKAVKQAYEAMSEPREGTILTVISDWAKKIEEQSKRLSDFTELLRVGLQTARQSLEETPTRLKVLAKAGVVDAGAQGFVHILEGISHFIESGKIDNLIEREIDRIEEAKHVLLASGDFTFRYCTEVLLEGTAVDRRKMRAELQQAAGDSLIVAGSSSRVRVHIHTDHPEEIFKIARRYGIIQRRKVDDMRRQQKGDFADTHTGKIALVIDSTCDLPAEVFQTMPVKYVPIWLYFGDQGYVDRITITAEEFFEKLRTSSEHPTTSQPSSADFVRVFSELLPRYEQIICLTLSKDVSGTYQAAVQAKRIVNCADIHIIDSGNVSVGFGLIALEALKVIAVNPDLDEILTKINYAIGKIRFYIYIETITYLIRGGRIGKVKGLAAKILNLRPVLSYANGTVKVVKKVKGIGQGLEEIMKRLRENLTDADSVRLAITHSDAPEYARRLQQTIREEFEIDAEFIVPTSPALGVHAGPGALGVAIIAGQKETGE